MLMFFVCLKHDILSQSYGTGTELHGAVFSVYIR